MAKPKKDRRVQYPPSVVYFKPQGIPMFQLKQEILTVDEYEAIRLVDKDGLDQEQAARRMGVSRATCARIMVSAHKGRKLCIEVEPLSMHGMQSSLGSRAPCRDDGGRYATFVSEVP
jgi:predicted DNA-binding protein (UPF0251 family)